MRIVAGGSQSELSGPGAPGFGSHLGSERAFEAITKVLADADPGRLAGVGVLGIGAAGADGDDAGIRRLAALVRERWGWDAAITSDVVTAHIGAFAGGAGTILVAGTGAVAGRVDPDGSWTRSDGWGPWLGDEGSGRWLGQTGLIAAVRSADGRGPSTLLEDDARGIASDLVNLPRAVASGTDVARSLAGFAPVVLTRAFEGDRVAGRIVDRAVRRLARTAASVAPAGGAVSVVGGLAQHPSFLALLVARLTALGLAPRRPAGSALDGAVLLAQRLDLLHERNVLRDSTS